MFTLNFALLSFVLLCLTASGEGNQKNIVQAQAANQQRVVAAEMCQGKVISTTKNTITIDEDKGGRRTLSVSNVLAAGKVPDHDPLRHFYPLDMLCVGDIVNIDTHRFADRSVIGVGIVICRRPGGRVPPSPNERPSSRVKHSEVMNAYQDFEERGIPLPAKYVPPDEQEVSAKLAAIRLREERERERQRKK